VNSSTAKPRIKKRILPADVLVSGVREVNSYLRGHPDMAEIVHAICRRAREEFGSTAELKIQLNHDQESDDPYLILYVRLPSYAADTRQRIDAVWQHFEEELRGRSGWIIATTDFRRVKGNGV
jgi:hypothetical protein